jgi:hypothetical protein
MDGKRTLTSRAEIAYQKLDILLYNVKQYTPILWSKDRERIIASLEGIKEILDEKKIQ